MTVISRAMGFTGVVSSRAAVLGLRYCRPAAGSAGAARCAAVGSSGDCRNCRRRRSSDSPDSSGLRWRCLSQPDAAENRCQHPERRLRRLDAQRQQRGQRCVPYRRLGKRRSGRNHKPVRLPGAGTRRPYRCRHSWEEEYTATQAQSAGAGRPRRAAIEDLRNVSGAGQLERVVGWPTAVWPSMARVYVNAAWLTAGGPGVRGFAEPGARRHTVASRRREQRAGPHVRI